ncbi:hypothetical protein K1719_024554 [Acacia pycnantha]|nr:hypothetical protein K1719_024554 [Acacia pycnantha]
MSFICYDRNPADHSLGTNNKRFQISNDNLRFIDECNAESRTCKLGSNRFADLTNDEFRAKCLGTRIDPKRRITKTKSNYYAPRVSDKFLESVDWRKEGAVVEVKDQRSCRSCWAFSIVSVAEGINKIVSGGLISLSEQELVDCDATYNVGCNGGLMDYGFQFIINNGGIDTEEDYSCRAVDGRCDTYRENARVVSNNGYEDIPANDKASLKKAVAHQPVSVAIEGGDSEFQLYVSGVFTGACGPSLDHENN